MRKISEKHCIVFDESGPTGKYETVELHIRENMVPIVEIEIPMRMDTINGQIAFFQAIVNELKEFREQKRKI